MILCYTAIYLILCILCGIALEQTETNTVAFWMIGALIIIVMGAFIPGYILVVLPGDILAGLSAILIGVIGILAGFFFQK